jgi:serine/threonine-protein kinase
MGVVYLAERDDGQYQQRVAVKVLHASPDAEELRRRFVAERQILASLKHRSIAQLLDGGVAEGQLPFLVMEHVDGVPITTYCDQRQLGIEARLRLFRGVCAAVHHAHQNLIIHRDIKPGNILVSGEGAVKLLDFGIAKLLDQSLGMVDQPQTRTGLRVMTPEYASPEQVRGESVTTASDVYALGVVLYELLSGRRPYYLTSGSPQELTHLICSLEPERPSVAITRPIPTSLSGAPQAITAESTARARGISPERLKSVLSGDLDAIVMMALRKEPANRYGSVDLLWQDLQRYLDGLPVLAHRGSRAYRARKFFGRHRVESAAAAVVVLSLAVGAGTAVRQATVAAQERDRAAQALVESEQSLRQSEGVTSFLVGLFDATAPHRGDGAITAEELLNRGTTQLETMRGQPLVQAGMLEAMGRVQSTMAHYPEARESLERSMELRVARLGPNHPEVARTLYYLGDVLRRMGEYQRADSVAQRAIAIRTAVMGPTHPAVAEVLAQRASIRVYLSDLSGAEALSRRALDIRRASLPPNDPLIGTSLELHASHLRRLGRLGEAEGALREAIAVHRAAGGPRSAEAGYVQLRLSDVVLELRGDTAEAESLLRSGLATMRATLGEENARTAWAMGDLALLLAQRGKYDEAERLVLRALETQRKVFGPQHPNVGEMDENLASVYTRARRFTDAERAEREALELYAQSLGPGHSTYAGALGRWADLLMELERYDEAILARHRALDIRRRLFGNNGALYGIDVASLARLYARKGEYTTADSLFGAALANQRQYVPANHIDVRRIYQLMAERYRLEGKRADSQKYMQLAQLR